MATPILAKWRRVFERESRPLPLPWVFRNRGGGRESIWKERVPGRTYRGLGKGKRGGGKSGGLKYLIFLSKKFFDKIRSER